jgi:hypothetical protein
MKFANATNINRKSWAPGFPATQHSPTSTCAAFVKESRMKFANATNINRKSWVAQQLYPG